MKALVLEAYNKLVYTDVPVPEYKSNEVLVRVKACGICGSDVHGMDGSTGRRIPPMIMGHEAAGEIAAVGREVSGFAIGDRVTFDSTVYRLDDWYTLRGQYNLSDNRQVLGVSPGSYRRDGAFAEYVVVPQHILYKIPDRVSFEQAAMVEPVAVAMHAVRLTDINIMDTVLVVGAGMIGLFLIQVLKHSNAGKIMAVDIDEKKLAMAKKFGADGVYNAEDKALQKLILGQTDGRGADVAFEAVGISPTIRTAIDNVRRGGAVTLVGNLSPTIDFPLQSVVTRQIKVQGSCAIAGEYPAVLKMIEQGAINVNAMLSTRAPLSEGAKWFKKLYDKTPGLNKVVLHP